MCVRLDHFKDVCIVLGVFVAPQPTCFHPAEADLLFHLNEEWLLFLIKW